MTTAPELESGSVSLDPHAPDHGAVIGGGLAAPKAPTKAPSQFTDVRRRFKKNKLAILGLAIIVFMVLVALLANVISPYDPDKINLTGVGDDKPLAFASASHVFGTDQLGRDNLSRVIFGSRVALIVGFTSLILSLIIGITLGAVAGYFGRFWDSLVMRIADIFFAFPLLIGAIVLIQVLPSGRSVTSVVIALGFFSWATVARLLRGSILGVKELEYIEAARSLGTSRTRIVMQHILPNALAPVLIYSTFSVGAAVVAEASLSYLGAGVGLDKAEWGNMVSTGQAYVGINDIQWIGPSIGVVLTTLGFVLAGDGLRDALDPKLR